MEERWIKISFQALKMYPLDSPCPFVLFVYFLAGVFGEA